MCTTQLHAHLNVAGDPAIQEVAGTEATFEVCVFVHVAELTSLLLKL